MTRKVGSVRFDGAVKTNRPALSGGIWSKTIRTIPHNVSRTSSGWGITRLTAAYRRMLRRSLRKSRKRVIRYSLLAANIAILLIVAVFVLGNPNAGRSVNQNALGITSEGVAADPLDQLSSADIAMHVARMTRLDEATAVVNQADTVNAQLSITPADDKVVAKPQIVATELKSHKDIKRHLTVEGDTISALAAKYGITSETIRWSNALTSTDAIPAGKELLISPVNGIVYQVKDGDTVDSVAQKFSANKAKIIAFNDAEVAGLKTGQHIVVPDGVLTPVARTPAIYNGGFSWGGYAPIYGGNGYDYGYCTWWVAVRRNQVGKPIPSNLGNASTWKVLAQRAGLAVGNTPAQYAVIWTPPRDYYGHVGFVEEVLPDGRVRVSDMNVAGWGRTSERILTPAQAAGYSYIY
jgi:surface antigen/LysM repeat protein